MLAPNRRLAALVEGYHVSRKLDVATDIGVTSGSYLGQIAGRTWSFFLRTQNDRLKNPAGHSRSQLVLLKCQLKS